MRYSKSETSVSSSVLNTLLKNARLHGLMIVRKLYLIISTTKQQKRDDPRTNTFSLSSYQTDLSTPSCLRNGKHNDCVDCFYNFLSEKTLTSWLYQLLIYSGPCLFLNIFYKKLNKWKSNSSLKLFHTLCGVSTRNTLSLTVIFGIYHRCYDNRIDCGRDTFWEWIGIRNITKRRKYNFKVYPQRSLQWIGNISILSGQPLFWSSFILILMRTSRANFM